MLVHKGFPYHVHIRCPMSRRLKLTLIPLLFIAAALFAGGSVGFSDDISASLTITSTTSVAGSVTAHNISFTTTAVTVAGTQIVVDYSAYGTGVDNGFNLSGVTLAGTLFPGFSTPPTAINIDNINI